MKNESEETIGQRIRKARKRLGYTQEQLADRMQTTKSMISYYENDHGDLKQSMISEFADILNTSVEFLMCGNSPYIEFDEDALEAAIIMSHLDARTRNLLLVQMRALAKSQV